MSNKVKCIMLIDDNDDDNMFHERVIKKGNYADVIVTRQTGMAALEYLKDKQNHENEHPDLIFLDINMPGMNGWEFLEEYNQLDKELQSRMIIVMLTTSGNPDDKAKASAINTLSDFKTKPLTKEMLDEIINAHF